VGAHRRNMHKKGDGPQRAAPPPGAAAISNLAGTRHPTSRRSDWRCPQLRPDRAPDARRRCERAVDLTRAARLCRQGFSRSRKPPKTWRSRVRPTRQSAPAGSCWGPSRVRRAAGVWPRNIFSACFSSCLLSGSRPPMVAMLAHATPPRRIHSEKQHIAADRRSPKSWHDQLPAYCTQPCTLRSLRSRVSRRDGESAGFLGARTDHRSVCQKNIKIGIKCPRPIMNGRPATRKPTKGRHAIDAASGLITDTGHGSSKPPL